MMPQGRKRKKAKKGDRERSEEVSTSAPTLMTTTVSESGATGLVTKKNLKIVT